MPSFAGPPQGPILSSTINALAPTVNYLVRQQCRGAVDKVESYNAEVSGDTVVASGSPTTASEHDIILVTG